MGKMDYSIEEVGGLERLETLVSHRLSMWKEIYPHMKYDENLLRIETGKWLYDKFSEKTMTAVGAITVNGILAGTGCILLEEDEPRPGTPLTRKPHILSMYTLPEYRKNGVATGILNFCIGWARERGYNRMTLNASEAGWKLYQKAGFRQTNEMLLVL